MLLMSIFLETVPSKRWAEQEQRIESATIEQVQQRPYPEYVDPDENGLRDRGRFASQVEAEVKLSSFLVRTRRSASRKWAGANRVGADR